MIYTATLTLDVEVSGQRVPRSDMREVLMEAISDCLSRELGDAALIELAKMGITADGVIAGLDDVEVV